MSEPHEELQELQEHAEHAQHEKPLAMVSMTMAVLAVLVACVTLLSHRAHTEEVVLQNKVSDQWNYYQAKKNQGESDERFLDQMDVLGVKTPAAEKMAQKYQAAFEKSKERQKELQDEAHKLENEFNIERRRGNRFDLAEGLLEAALVITSITLLTRKRGFWIFGCVVAMGGLAIAATAFAIHI
jgi:Domain of unknown function (DUF4337)